MIMMGVVGWVWSRYCKYLRRETYYHDDYNGVDGGGN